MRESRSGTGRRTDVGEDGGSRLTSCGDAGSTRHRAPAAPAPRPELTSRVTRPTETVLPGRYRSGRIRHVTVDETDHQQLALLVAGAKAACSLPLILDERHPLFHAALPDSDGVLRARW
ncbi:hypothetical protein SLITK23_13310 [Streptomyces lividans]|nr:predicted protein [Streptomyces lividans TK24]BDE38086.1 hypothetical protein SLITK23_13310 [Streptomyces lividans]